VFYIQPGLDLLETAADKVHLYTFCITYNKDLYVRLNRGYLFALRHNLQQRKLDTHTCFVQKQHGSPNHVDATFAQPSSCMDENANLGAIFVSHSNPECLMQWYASLQNDGD
jgi:hypothetical protein